MPNQEYSIEQMRQELTKIKKTVRYLRIVYFLIFSQLISGLVYIALTHNYSLNLTDIRLRVMSREVSVLIASHRTGLDKDGRTRFNESISNIWKGVGEDFNNLNSSHETIIKAIKYMYGVEQ